VVVLDASSTPLDRVSPYARAPQGQRAYSQPRRNYGTNVTLLAGLSLDGMTMPLVIEGSVTTAVFDA